ncbi:unnamed protein product [Rotaria socialis]|uniref:Essential MCU regulator, mitochondrial n=1 Tax=Rotaria socialis TaxID=392032 RepID=A0A817PN35_9BILA|nr:unnamed protein product [Rotaria socialis]CAF3343252.1 unnamed protein product [Rotaria socialis]CAF3419779.1 unnamed protein product [Rotaria socialis]CAF3702442.1 unnamed protein product [Rotaria socialis]CAF4223886.1 unnamed protein product [Rotaria socialis]
MASKKLCDNIVFPIIRRCVSVTQQTTTKKPARSFFIRFIEDRRKKSQQDDIRLEPYMSKGVYTESGAIRPMPKRYPLGIIKVLCIAIPFLYLGSLVSKYGALGLEKMDLFVYSDDDDDDDD